MKHFKKKFIEEIIFADEYSVETVIHRRMAQLTRDKVNRDLLRLFLTTMIYTFTDLSEKSLLDSRIRRNMNIAILVFKKMQNELAKKRGSKWFSIVHLKCPRCRLGDLFSEPNAYKLSKMLDMPKQCPVCKQGFVIEPGFYSGALWVSYPIVLLLIIPLALFILFRLQLSLSWSLLIPFTLLLTLQPLIMRYSRAIWINGAVSFDPNIKIEE